MSPGEDEAAAGMPRQIPEERLLPLGRNVLGHLQAEDPVEGPIPPRDEELLGQVRLRHRPSRELGHALDSVEGVGRDPARVVQPARVLAVQRAEVRQLGAAGQEAEEAAEQPLVQDRGLGEEAPVDHGAVHEHPVLPVAPEVILPGQALRQLGEQVLEDGLGLLHCLEHCFQVLLRAVCVRVGADVEHPPHGGDLLLQGLLQGQQRAAEGQPRRGGEAALVHHGRQAEQLSDVQRQAQRAGHVAEEDSVGRALRPCLKLLHDPGHLG
mmetsp:Transcript_2603/g.5173  ORF Transcript_2603/g.5173 Transcript_2603/m.5173 type:complete len:267 (+) Transcript_2603:146-946(+)